jgi:His/Glu/Gln/Arg/opine family amino acid ABC transporter permease subunit
LDVQIFLDALTSKALREGLILTLELTVVSFTVGLVIGLGMALLRGSRFGLVRAAAWTYIWVFRAIPTLVLLLFFWNGLPQLIPALKGPGYPAFVAAAIALSVNEGAYAAEIFRGGLLSIDDGQRLAARALGMPPFAVFRRVVLPQLVRVVIPPAANDFITMLKLTSLASVVSLREILTNTQTQIATTFRFAEWYTAAAIYYLVLVSLFMIVQAWLERRYIWLSQRGAVGGRAMFLRSRAAAR